MGLFHPGTSLVHRVPAGVKLAALCAAGIGSVFAATPVGVSAYLAAAVLVLVVARVPGRALVRQLRPVLVFVVVLAVFHALVSGPGRAYVDGGMLLALVLLATALTMTTPTSALVDVVVRVAGPLRRVGVDPERLGLLLALGLRAIPVVLGLAGEVRDAQRARGLGASPRAFAVPLIVRSLRHADRVGEALAARGIDD